MESLAAKWGGVSPRERLLVIALGGTAVFIVVWLVFTTIAGGLDKIEKKNNTTRKALAALHQVRLQRAQGVSRDTAPKVKIGNEPVALESYLEKIAKDVGVEIPGYSPQPENTEGDFTEVSTRFELRGLTIVELKELLQSIETGKGGRVIVNDLRIKRQFRSQEKLDVELIVSTFYKKASDDEEDRKVDGKAG